MLVTPNIQSPLSTQSCINLTDAGEDFRLQHMLVLLWLNWGVITIPYWLDAHNNNTLPPYPPSSKQLEKISQLSAYAAFWPYFYPVSCLIQHKESRRAQVTLGISDPHYAPGRGEENRRVALAKLSCSLMFTRKGLRRCLKWFFLSPLPIPRWLLRIIRPADNCKV